MYLSYTVMILIRCFQPTLNQPIEIATSLQDMPLFRFYRVPKTGGEVTIYIIIQFKSVTPYINDLIETTDLC